jgi:hypothetical protein
MPNWPERASTALTVYLERGVRALKSIRSEQWDEFDFVFRMRKAAFHNFRAADHLALKSGYSRDQETQLKLIWGQISALDTELIEEMQVAQKKMEAEMGRMAKVKATLGRFKSGQIQESNIEETF